MNAKERAARNAEIIKAYQDGEHDLDNLSDAFGLCKGTVYKVLRESDAYKFVNRKPRAKKPIDPNSPRAIRNREIAKLATEDLVGYSEIAEMYGLTRQAVYLIVRDECPNARDIRRHRLIERADDLIRAAADNGVTSEKLHDEYGKTATWWENRAKRLGIPLKNSRGNSVLRHEEIKQRNQDILEALASGMKQNEVAEKFGMNQSQISHIALSNGLPKRRLTGDEYDERNRKLQEDIDNGMELEEAAQKYGIGLANVNRMLAIGHIRPREETF